RPSAAFVRREMHGHPVKVGVVLGWKMLVGGDQAIILQARQGGNTRARECRQLFHCAILSGAIDQHVVVPWAGTVAIGPALGIEGRRLIFSGEELKTKSWKKEQAKQIHDISVHNLPA